MSQGGGAPGWLFITHSLTNSTRYFDEHYPHLSSAEFLMRPYAYVLRIWNFDRVGCQASKGEYTMEGALCVEMGFTWLFPRN